MAIDPLLSQAASRVAELQRGLGDEKRRQDQASAYQNRSFGTGGRSVAFDEGGKAGEAAGGSKADEGSQAFALSQTEEGSQDASGQPTGGDSARQAAALGFSTQLLERDAASEVVAVGQNSSQKATEAYNKVQIRITRDMPLSSQQVVTGSGMLMGFGVMDHLTKLDVTV